MPEARPASVMGQLTALLKSGSLSGLGEGHLFERFIADHDQAAFEELVARHGSMVFGICRRWLNDSNDVEDAFQATFLILLRKAASLRDRNSLSNWLYGVSLRVARRARSTAVRRLEREAKAGSDTVASLPQPDEIANREALTIIDEEIRRLPQNQQAALVLCLVEGRTHDSAAAELGWPLGTVKSRLAAARAKLASRLKRRGVEPSALVGLARIGENAAVIKPPTDLATRTLEAALQFAASRSIEAAAISTSARALIRGVLASTLLAQTMAILSLVAAIAASALALSMPLFLAGMPTFRPQPQRQAAESKPREAAGKVDLYGDPLPKDASETPSEPLWEEARREAPRPGMVRGHLARFGGGWTAPPIVGGCPVSRFWICSAPSARPNNSAHASPNLRPGRRLST